MAATKSDLQALKLKHLFMKVTPAELFGQRKDDEKRKDDPIMVAVQDREGLC